jgi:hypothetical protein
LTLGQVFRYAYEVSLSAPRNPKRQAYRPRISKKASISSTDIHVYTIIISYRSTSCEGTNLFAAAEESPRPLNGWIWPRRNMQTFKATVVTLAKKCLNFTQLSYQELYSTEIFNVAPVRQLRFFILQNRLTESDYTLLSHQFSPLITG